MALDPGHGGRDRFNQANWIVEADVVLDIALRAALLARVEGMTVMLTRERDVDFSRSPAWNPREDLGERAAIINRANCVDVAVSIHTDAAGSDARGVHAIYSLAWKGTGQGGELLANLLTDEVSRLAGLPVHRRPWTRSGSNGRDYYFMIREVRVPSLILECGFHTSRQDAALLSSSDTRQLIAAGIVSALKKYAPAARRAPTGAPALDPELEQFKDRIAALEKENAGLHARLRRIAELALETSLAKA